MRSPEPILATWCQGHPIPFIWRVSLGKGARRAGDRRSLEGRRVFGPPIQGWGWMGSRSTQGVALGGLGAPLGGLGTANGLGKGGPLQAIAPRQRVASRRHRPRWGHCWSVGRQAPPAGSISRRPSARDAVRRCAATALFWLGPGGSPGGFFTSRTAPRMARILWRALGWKRRGRAGRRALARCAAAARSPGGTAKQLRGWRRARRPAAN